MAFRPYHVITRQPIIKYKNTSSNRYIKFNYIICNSNTCKSILSPVLIKIKFNICKYKKDNSLKSKFSCRSFIFKLQIKKKKQKTDWTQTPPQKTANKPPDFINDSRRRHRLILLFYYSELETWWAHADPTKGCVENMENSLQVILIKSAIQHVLITYRPCFIPELKFSSITLESVSVSVTSEQISILIMSRFRSLHDPGEDGCSY